MFKKSLASVVTAAVLVAGPGQLALTAAAQTVARGPVSGVSVTPTIGVGLASPVSGASSFNMPSLTPGVLIAPNVTAVPSLDAQVPGAAAAAVVPGAKPLTLAATPGLPVAAKAAPVAVKGAPLAVIRSHDPKIGVAEKSAALNTLFENDSRAVGHEILDVLGRSAASSQSGLSRSSIISARSSAAIHRATVEKGRAAASLSDVTNLLKRAWNAILGLLGIGVKKMETPEVMAQRIIDQLNAAKPVYNRKVQEASTLVEKLKLQVEGEIAKVAELEQGITALLSDSDPANDVMAAGLINQQKTLNASIASTNEQIGLAEKTLAVIKEERARFFADREEMLAKVQAGLTKAKSAEIQKQIAELKGGFQVGDLKDNMDRFEDAVDDKVAESKGTVDSAESNPDQVLKKAKDSLKNQEVQDEIAQRKKAIEQAKKDKGAAAGEMSRGKALGYFAKVIGIGLALLAPGQSTLMFAVIGGVALMLPPAQGRWLGRQLAVIGLGTLAVGGVATLAVAKLGLAVGAFGVGIGFVVPAGIALAAGIIATFRARTPNAGPNADMPGKSSDNEKGRSGGLLLELGIGAAVVAVIAMVSAPFRNLLLRAWNAILGLLGIGVKKMETPEVMAQRIIDQLNAQKPVYNRKVQEASTLVEKLRLQIEKQEAQSAELDRAVTAILSDSDPLNDVMAASLLSQKKTVDASTAMTKEQFAVSEKTLASIKEERARFFADREEMLAKIQAGLTKAKSAEIQKQIAELKGGFQIGDLKDNMDRFEDAVNDKVADSKGTVDSAESNPDQVLKKAKDSLKGQEIQDEIAQRKKAIEQAKKDKGEAGGK